MGRFVRLVWSIIDRFDYTITSARLSVADWICGPDPPTAADRQREAGRERSQEVFPRGSSRAAWRGSEEHPTICALVQGWSHDIDLHSGQKLRAGGGYMKGHKIRLGDLAVDPDRG
jgi:hypothetical protein